MNYYESSLLRKNISGSKFLNLNSDQDIVHSFKLFTQLKHTVDEYNV